MPEADAPLAWPSEPRAQVGGGEGEGGAHA